MALAKGRITFEACASGRPENKGGITLYGNGRGNLGDDLRRRMIFLRSMISHPRRVGAVWPTSRWAVRDLLDMGDLPQARTVVEFGVGTGVYTGEILERLSPDATFLAFEIEPDLASAVAERLGDDPRLRVINDSAENVEQYLDGAKADYIVSSIPFTSLPAGPRQSILGAAREALKPEGKMLVLQYSTTVLPYLQRLFSPIERRLSPLNIPPAFLFACSVPEEPIQEEEAQESTGSGGLPYVLGALALGTLFLLRRRRRRKRRSRLF